MLYPAPNVFVAAQAHRQHELSIGASALCDALDDWHSVSQRFFALTLS
jgi:hypothetical protein